MSTLKQRADAVAYLVKVATPGPWHSRGEIRSNYRAEVAAVSKRGKIRVLARCPALAEGTPEGTSAFIAHAPDMAQLIAEQQAEIERLSAKVAAMATVCGLASELSLLWGDADDDDESDDDDVEFIEQMYALRVATREYRAQLLSAPINAAPETSK